MLTVFVNRHGVSSCDYSKIAVMATKVQRTPFDHAAEEELGHMVDDTGLSLRGMASKMGDLVSHARIADILNGEKGPIRLSEFIAICEACGEDPAEVLRRIIDAANTSSPSDDTDVALASADHGFDIDAIAGMSDQEKVQWLADHADDYEAVAKDLDWQAEQEHYEDLP